MGEKSKIPWLTEPEDKDYPAAQSYLGLVYSDTEAISLVNKLKNAKVVQFKAKDVFRASGLSLLGISNSHVAKDQQKIKEGKSLSPILLVRDSNNSKVVIADGYHRLCAVYSMSEDELIPCKIV